jgi:hypothetical protein
MVYFSNFSKLNGELPCASSGMRVGDIFVFGKVIPIGYSIFIYL